MTFPLERFEDVNYALSRYHNCDLISGCQFLTAFFIKRKKQRSETTAITALKKAEG